MRKRGAFPLAHFLLAPPPLCLFVLAHGVCFCICQCIQGAFCWTYRINNTRTRTTTRQAQWERCLPLPPFFLVVLLFPCLLVAVVVVTRPLSLLHLLCLCSFSSLCPSLFFVSSLSFSPSFCVPLSPSLSLSFSLCSSLLRALFLLLLVLLLLLLVVVVLVC